MRVAYVHPDLGLGGAERLIVDAIVETLSHGHEVHVFTTYYDPARCFEETKEFDIRVAGNWFPRVILGKLHAFCAYFRCLLLTLHIILQVRSSAIQYDVIVVDQVSVVVPFLKWFTTSKVLFYCHFPDLLLAQRGSALKRVYRAVLDWVEESTTGAADCLLVNSHFTQGVFRSTFRRLTRRGVTPAVLYPAVNIPTDAALQSAAGAWKGSLVSELAAFVSEGPMFLSINRFERKKGLKLALEALRELKDQGSAPDARLVMAGGYDKRVRENVEHLEELQTLAADLQLEDSVKFVPSFTDAQRQLLLAACIGVLYTPQNEHFGIVPLEAMAAGRPVVACNSGGPTESVVQGKTGLLCDPSAAAFRQAMEVLLDPTTAMQMGVTARKHVQDTFSRAAFGDKLNSYLLKLAARS